MLEKRFRLRKNYQFNYVYKNGKSVSDKNMVIVYCRNKNGKPKVGFSISKKFGKAVKRNKMRRRLREIVYKRYGALDSRFNYVFLPRGVCADITFAEIVSSVERLMSKIGCEN